MNAGRIRFFVATFFVASTLQAVTPSITSFTPASGVAGTVVTITGAGFTGVTSVNFHDVSATAFHVDSSTQITVTAPSGVTDGPITLFGLFGSVVSTASFTVPAPFIAGLAPRQIVPGTVVYVDGSNFTDTTSVTFDDIQSPFPKTAASFNVLSDSRLVVITPSLPLFTSARITVTTTGGGPVTSVSSIFIIAGLLANPWFDTDVAGWNFDPTFLTLTWSSLDGGNDSASGSGLFTNTAGHYALTAHQCASVTGGTRYTAGARVFVPPNQAVTGLAYIGVIWYSAPGCFNGFIASDFSSSLIVSRFVGSWNSHFVNVAAPAGAVAASFVLENWPDATTGTFQANYDNAFFDVERPPAINSFSPALGVGGNTDVTIIGSDFYGTAAVKFNGMASPLVNVVSASQIVARVPNGATSGPIEVDGPDHSSGVTGANFRVIQPPWISQVSPSAGQVNTVVRIDGADLDVVTSVTFAGTPATFSILSDSSGTYVQATVPPLARSGVLGIRNPAGTTNANFTVTARTADFSADGQSEVLLQNLSNGNVALWFLDHAFNVVSGAVVGYPGSSYSVVTSGDFNGDGFADLMLQNRSTGSVAIWLMQGTTIINGAVIANPGTAWAVVGSGDFNRDGKTDVILQNRSNGFIAEWQMNGASIASAGLVALISTAWHVVGVGDVDANGTSDIVLQNSTTSDVALWQMDGFTIRKGLILGTPGVDWRASAVADFDGDGWADVVLQNTSTQDIALWTLYNLSVNGRLLGNGGPWNVAGAGDYDGDGVAEILLYEPIGGGVAVWKLTNGLTARIIGVPGPTWMPIAK